ncbi:MAG: metallophosphoesterase [Candidatus Hermodarchaeota archaeon]
MIEKSYLKNLIKSPKLISELKYEELSNIFQNVKGYFEEENLLLEFRLDGKEEEIYILGDIHGNLQSLVKLIEIIEKKNPKLVIFLGDIVDRGSYQLECLILVLALKIIEPSRYFLLRGNHETLEMNQYYGFFQDFISKFKDQSKFNEILSIYDVLPICAVINAKILCLHGGIPEDIDILKKMKNKKPKDLDKTSIKLINPGIYQILWNDPKDVEILKFSNSFRGPGIKFFGQKAFDDFMEKNNLQFLIRAHECFPEGYRWFFNKRLLSIFSSANYRGYFSPNPASYAIIRDNNLIPMLLQ